jgi:2-amino-4-hydroxy-6-hydroxymethyldihydropteridine diphosphokinase
VKALALLSTSENVNLIDVSPVVESKALTLAGVDSSKPKFLNCVAEIETTLKPEDLLALTQSIEKKLGRVQINRWGNRNIDIDIITYGKIYFRSPSLVIPHPETHKRAFVIVPWYLMDQQAELPSVGKIAKLAEVFVNQVKLK